MSDAFTKEKSPRDEEYGGVMAGSKHESQTEDAVFGEVVEGGPNYRNVSLKGTIALMMKTQIGLGVLSIPAVFDAIGLIPGILCLIAIATMTGWSSYIVGVFKLRHPEVYGVEDVGDMFFGRIGREVFGLMFALFWTFVAGSGMLGVSIGLNALSTHGTCTAVFVAVAAIITFGLSSIQTLGRITWLAWIGLFGILAALFSLTISVGVQGRPAGAPDGPWESDFKLFGSPSFDQAAAALSTIVFAYAGCPAYLNIVSEMRDPRQFTKALAVSQSLMTALYLAIGVTVYYYCGSYVASPALGSAGVVMKKVCYGLALPGLIVTSTLVTHITAKYFFLRFLRGSRHLNHNTPIHWMSWLGCTAGISLVAYIIASAIPVFGGLVSLIGGLFGTLMCFQLMGGMWLYDNWNTNGKPASAKRWLMLTWCAFILIAGTFLTISGTYGSIVGIIDSYKGEGGSRAWSCADNSNST